MRKIMSAIFILMLIAAVLSGANRFLISFTGNYVTSSDSVYRKVYGSGEFCPEFRAGVRIFNNVYGWAGYGFLSSKGLTYPDLKLETEARKKYLSAGIGYQGKGKFTYRIDAGLLYVNWEEKAIDKLNKGTAFGFRFGAAAVYNWTATFFTEISSSYLIASDRIDDISLKLGGFIAGVGIGLRF
ncbi:hypothetical protein ACFLRB_03695 [Acidobacteriota bacterium]